MTVVGIMCTNGGTHSAGKWATVTAGHIVQIAEGSDSAESAIGRKLELSIIDILEQHHQIVQDGERSVLESEGVDRLHHEYDAHEHCSVAEIVAEIVAAATALGNAKIAEHFAKPEVVGYVTETLTNHFAMSMNIERQWYADKSSDPKAVAFNAAQNAGA